MPVAANSQTQRESNPDDSGPNLLLTREVANRYRFASVDGAIAYLRQRDVKPIRRGRAFLWRRAEVEALFDAERSLP